MVDAGVLSTDDHVELIEGDIVVMAPMGDRHALCVNKLTALLVPPAVGRAIVQVRLPVDLSDLSEPEPDLSLLRWRGEFYAHPAPADLLLVIEISDTSLAFDRSVKGPLYAVAGVPEYWIVNLAGEALEVHRDPQGGQWGDVERLGRGATAPVPGLDGVTVDVDFLLG